MKILIVLPELDRLLPLARLRARTIVDLRNHVRSHDDRDWKVHEGEV